MGENQKWYGPQEWCELLETFLQACRHMDYRTCLDSDQYPDSEKLSVLAWAEGDFRDNLESGIEWVKSLLESAEWWASTADDAGEL